MLVEHHERLVDLEQELHLNIMVDLEPDLDVLVEHHERLVDLEQELHLNIMVDLEPDLDVLCWSSTMSAWSTWNRSWISTSWSTTWNPIWMCCAGRAP